MLAAPAAPSTHATGDRVGTLAFSSYRHFELYFATPGIGAVCHTVNPRLHADQLAFVLNDAGKEARSGGGPS